MYLLITLGMVDVRGYCYWELLPNLRFNLHVWEGVSRMAWAGSYCCNYLWGRVFLITVVIGLNNIVLVMGLVWVIGFDWVVIALVMGLD